MRTSETICKVIPRLFDVLVFGGFAAFIIYVFYNFSLLLEKYPDQVSRLINFAGKFFA